jgi:peptidoglycan hydrolase FlgJ
MALSTPMVMPPEPALPTATPLQRRAISETAQTFEGQLLGILMQPMFDGLATDGPFGGGAGESTYRGFLVEAISKQVAKSGGVGLADPVAREMLKMQGLQ